MGKTIVPLEGELGSAEAQGWEGKIFRQVCADSLDVVSAAADRNALLLALGRLGWDDRPGVSLDEQGRPDILWLPVPAQEAPVFYIARYPVTQTQFQAFIEAGDGYSDPRWWVDFPERQGQAIATGLA